MRRGSRRDPAMWWACSTCLLTTIWIALMVASVGETASLVGWRDVRAYLGADGFGPSIAYWATYLNATALTITNTRLFQLLVRRVPTSRRIYATSVAAYGALNVFVYGTQVTLVPWLVRLTAVGSPGDRWLRQLVQLEPTSASAILNAVAYALFGVAAWGVARSLWRCSAPGTVTSVLLAGNSVACWVGLVGLVFRVSWLQVGIVLGGGLFWLGLFPLIWHLGHVSQDTIEERPDD